MTIIKNIMLASAALIVGGTVAQAADLPLRKAAPVEYVRICEAFGTGFFYIPGTDTCLRIGGQVRAEYTVRGGAPTKNISQWSLNQAGVVYPRDVSVLRGRGYLNADARTQTAYGTLRTYVQIRSTIQTTQSGPVGGGSTGAVTFDGVKAKTSIYQGLTNPSTLLDKGFIQFAGITAGRAQSFFDFDAQSRELLSNTMANSNQPTELFAYTATFGGGFTGTLSIEDRNERSIGDNGAGLSALTFTGKATDKATYLAYNGETIPDIVGSLRVEQDWGSAQLSGAYHQLSSQTVTVNGAAVNPGDVSGFAALAGVTVKLPMIAKGDSFTIQGTYEKGAMDYINSLNYDNGLSNIFNKNLSVGIPVNDGFVLPNGKIGTNSGYGIYGGFTHYWTPNWYTNVFGDYTHISNPRAAQLLTASGDNARVYQIGGNLIWTPVKDLTIGGEVLYSNLKLSGANTLGAGTAVVIPANPSDIRGRLSLRRSF